MHADETVTNASSNAQTNARGRFMVGLLPRSSGKVRPFAPAGRFEIKSVEIQSLREEAAQPPGSDSGAFQLGGDAPGSPLRECRRGGAGGWGGMGMRAIPS